MHFMFCSLEYLCCTPVNLSLLSTSSKSNAESPSPFCLQYWRLAVEEADELVARRAGKKPATEHDPVDFTKPGGKAPDFRALGKAWAASFGAEKAKPKGAGSCYAKP